MRRMSMIAIVAGMLTAIGGLAVSAQNNYTAKVPEGLDAAAAPIYGIKIPSGYRDWT